jgi:hypothetical protein
MPAGASQQAAAAAAATLAGPGAGGQMGQVGAGAEGAEAAAAGKEGKGPPPKDERTWIQVCMHTRSLAGGEFLGVVVEPGLPWSTVASGGWKGQGISWGVAAFPGVGLAIQLACSLGPLPFLGPPNLLL